jgi:predicted component of type VI protein secretion system
MIKITSKLALAAILTLLLAACSESEHDTLWYVQNTHEQAIQLEHCNSNPDEAKTANCISVQEAEIIIDKGTDSIKKYIADHAK